MFLFSIFKNSKNKKKAQVIWEAPNESQMMIVIMEEK